MTNRKQRRERINEERRQEYIDRLNEGDKVKLRKLEEINSLYNKQIIEGWERKSMEECCEDRTEEDNQIIWEITWEWEDVIGIENSLDDRKWVVKIFRVKKTNEKLNSIIKTNKLKLK